ncbi:hypothetical protein QQ045_007026 [Rhodiola kirilowii]
MDEVRVHTNRITYFERYLDVNGVSMRSQLSNKSNADLRDRNDDDEADLWRGGEEDGEDGSAVVTGDHLLRRSRHTLLGALVCTIFLAPLASSSTIPAPPWSSRLRLSLSETDSLLRDSLDVVAKDLAVAFDTSLTEALAPLSAARLCSLNRVTFCLNLLCLLNRVTFCLNLPGMSFAWRLESKSTIGVEFATRTLQSAKSIFHVICYTVHQTATMFSKL